MTTKSFLQKHIPAALVLLICTGVCFLFCLRKTGLFIDEIYSYGLANSNYAPYLTDVKGGSIADVLFTRIETEAYLTVGDDDAFALGSVYYNQTRDVHPPLYYWLFNAVSSFARFSSSKWIGLGINLAFYLLTLCALYALADTLFVSRTVAAVATALYGLSPLATSTVVTIRMYMMLTFFTVLFALVTAKLLHTQKKGPLYPLVTLVIFLGMMTQYYFVFYAFFLCAAYDLHALVKKDYRSFSLFSMCALLGVGLMIALFPASLRQLFIGNGQVVGGSTILETLRDTSAYAGHLRSFLEARHMFKAPGIIFLLCLVGCIPFLKQFGAGIPLDALVVILPAPVAFLVVAIISPVQELRYIYNLAPILVLIAAIPLRLIDKAAGKTGYFSLLRAGILAIALMAGLWNAKTVAPNTLFPEQAAFDAAIAPYTSDPCVYISDGYYAPLTQDLLQLKQFDNFFVTFNPESEALQSYLSDAEEAVIYIDTNPFWSSGYNAPDVLKDIFHATGFSSSELLYVYDFEGNGGLSATYLIRK